MRITGDGEVDVFSQIVTQDIEGDSTPHVFTLATEVGDVTRCHITVLGLEQIPSATEYTPVSILSITWNGTTQLLVSVKTVGGEDIAVTLEILEFQ